MNVSEASACESRVLVWKLLLLQLCVMCVSYHTQYSWLSNYLAINLYNIIIVACCGVNLC